MVRRCRACGEIYSPKDGKCKHCGTRYPRLRWFNNIVRTEIFVFAALQLIVALYFAFVTTEYANHPIYAATLPNGKWLYTKDIPMQPLVDQLFAILFFVLAGMALAVNGKVKKTNGKAPKLFYIYLIASGVLSIAYLAVSEVLLMSHVGSANYVFFMNNMKLLLGIFAVYAVLTVVTGIIYFKKKKAVEAIPVL